MHIYNDDAEFLEELQAKGMNAEVIMQLANSPDMNLLGLGFFWAIQSANDKILKGEGEMIQHIQQTLQIIQSIRSIRHGLH